MKEKFLTFCIKVATVLVLIIAFIAFSVNVMLPITALGALFKYLGVF